MKFQKKKVFFYLVLIILPFLFYFNWFYNFNTAVWTYGDGEFSYFSYRNFMLQSWKNGVFPFWNHFINLGQPFYTDPQAEVLYPLNIFYLFLPFNPAFNLIMMIHFCLAGIFMYLFLKSLKVSNFASLLGAIAFAFCGSINTRRGHVSVEYTLIWVPLIFFAYEKIKQTHSVRYIILLSLACMMQFFAGFTQASFYTLFALGLYMLYSLSGYSNKKIWLKETLFFTIIFLGLSLVQLVPTLKTAVEVGRQNVSYDIFASYSLPFRNLTALINPLYMGFEYPGSPLPLFFKQYTDAENLTEFSLYAGVFPLVFFVWAVFNLKKYKNTFSFWVVLAVFALIFSLGGHVPYFYKIFHKLPGFNSFRVPARMLFIFNFCIATVFALGINIFTTEKNHSIKWYLRAFLVMQVILTSYIVSSGRGQFSSPEVLVSLFISVVFWLLAEFNAFKYQMQTFAKVIITVFLLMDLWSFGFFNSNIFTKIQPKNDFANVIKELDPSSEFRILTIAGIGGELSFDFLGRDRNMITQVRSLIGHTSFIPKVFMEALRSDEAGTFYDFDYFLRNLDLIAALNTKFVIINNTEPNHERYVKLKEKLKLIKTYNQFDIFEIPNAKPLIFPLANTKLTESNVIDQFNYTQTGLIKSADLEKKFDANAAVYDIKINSGHISATVKTDAEAFLAVSETYNSAWRAKLNGSPTKIIKLNGLIMGIQIPKGEFLLELNYTPVYFYICAIISLLFLIFAGILFVKPDILNNNKFLNLRS